MTVEDCWDEFLNEGEVVLLGDGFNTLRYLFAFRALTEFGKILCTRIRMINGNLAITEVFLRHILDHTFEKCQMDVVPHELVRGPEEDPCHQTSEDVDPGVHRRGVRFPLFIDTISDAFGDWMREKRLRYAANNSLAEIFALLGSYDRKYKVNYDLTHVNLLYLEIETGPLLPNDVGHMEAVLTQFEKWVTKMIVDRRVIRPEDFPVTSSDFLCATIDEEASRQFTRDRAGGIHFILTYYYLLIQQHEVESLQDVKFDANVGDLTSDGVSISDLYSFEKIWGVLSSEECERQWKEMYEFYSQAPDYSRFIGGLATIFGDDHLEKCGVYDFDARVKNARMRAAVKQSRRLLSPRPNMIQVSNPTFKERLDTLPRQISTLGDTPVAFMRSIHSRYISDGYVANASDPVMFDTELVRLCRHLNFDVVTLLSYGMYMRSNWKVVSVSDEYPTWENDYGWIALISEVNEIVHNVEQPL
jgi:hypothetical protein